MDPATDNKVTDTVKQEKASAQQASRACSPSWFCTFSLLALSFYSFRTLSALAPRTVVLHAVPESELVAVSLTVNPELFSSAIKSTGKRVVFGKPSQPLQLPTDFLPPAQGGAVVNPLVAARSPSTPPPPPSSSPPPPPPPEGPKPWIVEAQLPPRPKNASRAAAAMARAAAATRAARVARPLPSEDGTPRTDAEDGTPRTDAAQQLALPADERLALVSPPADGDASRSKLSLTTLSGADAGLYAYEVLEGRAAWHAAHWRRGRLRRGRELLQRRRRAARQGLRLQPFHLWSHPQPPGDAHHGRGVLPAQVIASFLSPGRDPICPIARPPLAVPLPCYPAAVIPSALPASPVHGARPERRAMARQRSHSYL